MQQLSLQQYMLSSCTLLVPCLLCRAQCSEVDPLTPGYQNSRHHLSLENFTLQYCWSVVGVARFLQGTKLINYAASSGSALRILVQAAGNDIRNLLWTLLRNPAVAAHCLPLHQESSVPEQTM